MMADLISRLSELRCQYNCFDENERDAYHTLSEAIKALSDVPDTNVGDAISRKEEATKEIEEYIADADKAISEDPEYIRGWKSAMLVALEILSKLEGV